MNIEKISRSNTQATLTPEDAMKLIQHIASYGTEAKHLSIQMNRYSDDDSFMQISVNNGFGIMLKVTESIAVIAEEVGSAGLK